MYSRFPGVRWEWMRRGEERTRVERESVFDAEAQGGKFFWVRSQYDGVSGAELLLRVPHCFSFTTTTYHHHP